MNLERGSIEALTIAVATLVRSLPQENKERFIAAYRLNASSIDDVSLFSKETDEWREGLSSTSALLLRLIASP